MFFHQLSFIKAAIQSKKNKQFFLSTLRMRNQAHVFRPVSYTICGFMSLSCITYLSPRFCFQG